MRPIVVGASGWIGSALTKTLDADGVPSTLISDARTPSEALSALRTHFGKEGVKVIVNAAGLRNGSAGDLRRANTELPRLLAEYCEESSAHLVHLGSAAEYGLIDYGSGALEEWACNPTSDYGRSKLEGTLSVLETLPTVTVLRPFNVVGPDLPRSSPLIDVRDRTWRGRVDGEVRLLSAAVTRDYVTLDFVCQSVNAAARTMPAGIFNVCSGVGTTMESIAMSLARLWGFECRVSDEGQSTLMHAVGNPGRWYRASGLRQRLGANEVAKEIVG